MSRKISISTLFPNENKDIGRSSRKISINSLFPAKDEDDPDSCMKQILDNRRKRKKDLAMKYKNMLNRAVLLIKQADKEHKTDITFVVPRVIPDYSEYNSDRAIQYVEKSLRKRYFDTFKINSNSVFITWANAEENKENADRLVENNTDSDKSNRSHRSVRSDRSDGFNF